MEKEKTLKITSIEDLLTVANGEIVELPPFDNEHPFVARMKRPSLLAMAKTGKIPNSLLKQANELFTNGAGGALRNSQGNEMAMSEVFEIMDVICEEAFVEPKYQDIKDAGIELTDEQILFVFTYTQRGLDALEPFRK